MNEENIIQLTNKIYKMTLLFPKKEPLRYKMRETADEILADIVTWEVFHSPNPGKAGTVDKREEKELIFTVEKDLQILRSYFEVAKWQNWLSYFDVLAVEEEYDKILSDFKNEARNLEAEAERTKTAYISQQRAIASLAIDNNKRLLDAEASKAEESLKRQDSASQSPINSRKEKILKILEEKTRIQVWQTLEFFPQVSKRTLRRDFVQLLEQGLIERIGERNNTFYQLKPSI